MRRRRGRRRGRRRIRRRRRREKRGGEGGKETFEGEAEGSGAVSLLRKKLERNISGIRIISPMRKPLITPTDDISQRGNQRMQRDMSASCEKTATAMATEVTTSPCNTVTVKEEKEEEEGKDEEGEEQEGGAKEMRKVVVVGKGVVEVAVVEEEEGLQAKNVTS